MTNAPDSEDRAMSNLPIVDPDIDYDSFITEDHKPVDRLFIEKLHRLLTESLYASWPGPAPGRSYLVMVNVGWFYQRKTPAIVPDCLLSLEVSGPEDLHVKQGHSYYQWDMGKQPDVIIEAVSDRTGGEEDYKLALYARLGVPYYAIYDPEHLLSNDTLLTYELVGGEYRLTDPGPWPKIGLGLRLWQGWFEGYEDEWLRWCDMHGEIILTGEERAKKAQEQVEQAQEQARQAQEQARLAEEQTRLAEERIRILEAELQRFKTSPPPTSES